MFFSLQLVYIALSRLDLVTVTDTRAITQFDTVPLRSSTALRDNSRGTSVHNIPDHDAVSSGPKIKLPKISLQ